MTDVRQTLHMPYSREPDANKPEDSQPEPAPQPTPGPAPEPNPDGPPEPIPEPLQDDKPPPVVLAGDPSDAHPEPAPHGAPAVAEIITREGPESGEHGSAHSGAHGDDAVIHPEDQTPPLWSDDEARKMSQRWERIQDEFVDKPRKAVEEANHLVAAVATRLTEMFDEERARLEGEWHGGGEVSAEELHIAAPALPRPSSGVRWRFKRRSQLRGDRGAVSILGAPASRRLPAWPAVRALRHPFPSAQPSRSSLLVMVGIGVFRPAGRFVEFEPLGRPVVVDNVGFQERAAQQHPPTPALHFDGVNPDVVIEPEIRNR